MTANFILLPETRCCQKSAAAGADSLRKDEDVAVEGGHAETDPVRRNTCAAVSVPPSLDGDVSRFRAGPSAATADTRM